MNGHAPSEPGIYRTTWRMVDETRAWFGPEMWLSYRVTECAAAAPDPVVVDEDLDGSPAGVDCDDADAAVHPGAQEICEDGVDSDCDGVEPACDTPILPTGSPDIDDPGFDWSHGETVHTGATRHRIQSSCSAAVGRTSSLAPLALIGLALLLLRRR
ncbi:MAG: hypothetical protein K1X94_08620 [Sandaracinaceae bacterium]|nr:hypothetical protein [Sandaracinaceae bacterium]